MKELLILILSFYSDFKQDANYHHVQLLGDSVLFELTDLTEIRQQAAASKYEEFWLMEIDSTFAKMYLPYPLIIKTIVYHQLGHILLNAPHQRGKHIMNPNRLRPTTDKMVIQLFEVYDCRKQIKD